MSRRGDKKSSHPLYSQSRDVEVLSDESPVAYSTSVPKPLTSGAGSRSCSCQFGTLLTLLILSNILLAVVTGLLVKSWISHNNITDELEKTNTFLGIQSSFLAQLQAAGETATFNALQAGIVMNPIPPLKYMTLTGTEVRMAYRTRGNCMDNSSTMLIYIHELGLSSTMWNPHLNQLGSEYCCIAVDLLGHGNSDPATALSGGSITAQASYIRQFIISSGILSQPRDLHFIASGFGGSVAMQYIAAHPGDVSKILVVNPTPVLVNPVDVNCGGMPNYGFVQGIAAAVLTNMTAYAYGTIDWYFASDACSTNPQMPVVRNILAKIIMDSHPQSVAEGWLSWGLLDHRGLYQNINIPLGLVVGANYDGTGAEPVNLAELARDLSGSGTSLRVFAGAGGLPQITHIDEIAMHIDDFVSGQDIACTDMHPSWLGISV